MMKRLSEGYKEGFARAKASVEAPRASDAIDPNAGRLRPSDAVAAVILTAVVVEFATFGAGFLGAWLLVAPTSVGSQARLLCAASTAVRFRSATRLPRLLLECASFAAVRRTIRLRPTSARAPFVKERLSQSLAVFAALFMTARAASRLLLESSAGPAAPLLLARATTAAAPLTAALPSLLPIATAVGEAAQRAWAVAQHVAAAAVVFDGALRQTAVGSALYALSDVERYLAGSVRLLIAALTAFVHEVVLPIAKAFGTLTMQTLG